MTLDEFIETIPFVILDRGRAYLERRKIIELDECNLGDWYAQVEGNYGDYEVTIVFDENDNVTTYGCDCPHDADICKHIAAVALAIKGDQVSPKDSDHKLQTEDWTQLIEDATLEELRSFMLDYGYQNKDFRHQVQLTFAKPSSDQNDNNIPYYRQQISEVFENYTYKGYIDYDHSFNATHDVSNFQRKADYYYSTGTLNEAFSISAAIAEESIKVIEYMDDSAGGCGDLIVESFEVVRNVLKSTPSSELKETIFNWLRQQMQNSDYDNYGVGDILEQLFFDAAIALEKVKIAYQFIDNRLIDLKKKDDWSSEYALKKYLGRKIELLQSEGRTDEAEQIIDDHLKYKEFRQIRVDQALSGEDHKKAEKLILEGIKDAERDNTRGIVHQWKDQLLELYKQRKEAFKFNKLVRELFVENSSDIEYFKLYKQTSPREGWKERRDKLIAELKDKKNGHIRGISLDNMAGIYIEEEMIDELFELVRLSLDLETIIKYTEYLKEKYSSELLDCYKVAIEGKAERAGRSVYRDLVRYLKAMSKLKDGMPAAKALKNSLLEKYKNRPAMSDEFWALNLD
ncbi:hypothetical protein EYV94_23045 [Puteibacter caeruleilacunae]|nr:hypothetical protein EYV94_23045 [Puteibacter caeruleilacunae]